MERDWRPSDAAERAHEQDRVAWHHLTHPAPLSVQWLDKDHIFTAEEAVRYDREVPGLTHRQGADYQFPPLLPPSS